MEIELGMSLLGKKLWKIIMGVGWLVLGGNFVLEMEHKIALGW